MVGAWAETEKLREWKLGKALSLFLLSLFPFSLLVTDAPVKP